MKSLIWSVNRSPTMHGVLPIFRALLVASMFVMSVRMWSVQEHIVFLVILFALVVSILAKPAQQSVVVLKLTLIPAGLLVLLGIVMILSSFWAPQIHSTLAYAGFSVLQILIGLALSQLVNMREAFAGLALGAFGVSLYSLAVSFAQGFPSNGAMPMGLFTNQSDLSHILGIGVVAAATLISRSVAQSLLVAAPAGVLLWHISTLGYLTTTVSLVAAAAMVAIIAVVKKIRPSVKPAASLVFFLLGIFSLAVLWIFRQPLQILVGKTPDFSGRVPIWERFWGNIQEKPFTGVGWGWTRDEFGGTDRIVPHQEIFPAHNGFIETAFALGIPAAILLAFSLGFALYIGYFNSIDSSATWVTAGVPVLLTYLVVHDLAGTWLPRVLGLFLMGLLFGLIARNARDKAIPVENRHTSPRLSH